ncbi:MAG: PrsW family intramembrane metalloprotease [Gammaproteobacteria bacterium]
MRLELVLSAVLLPFLFWVAYHYYHDRHRPEPVINLVVTVGLGAVASLIAGFGYHALDLAGMQVDVDALAETTPMALFAYAVLGIGLIEELAKLLPFVLVVLRFKDFDEALDGVVYASFLALGFATVENLYYLDHLTRGEAIARGFAGPVVHMVFASIWGHRIGMARLTGGRIFGVALIWLGVSALVHGVYDFIVLAFSDVSLLLASAFIVAIWLWRLNLVSRLKEPVG